ncbi:MAG: DUF58 domain-containing protein [Planctomycetes bacterium]|nr:DUF58 domain-containing protein [Planctomycetota bacterium]NOG53643.1 DUF58 domain-containing protein [Planctomycetota bacterium]
MTISRTEIANPLLDPLTLKSLGGLFVIAETLVSGLHHGRHASPDRGISTEFYDYRAYASGDDLRHVDWKHYGRTDRLYVRRYRHFADLTVHLVVDASASMSFASVEPNTAMPSKWDVARWLAAATAYLTSRQADRIALSLAGGTGPMIDESSTTSDSACVVAPGRSWDHLKRIVSLLEHTTPAGTLHERPHLAASGMTIPTRQKMIILGDFLDDPQQLLDTVNLYRLRENEVTLAQILTDDELDPSFGGIARIEDTESHTKRHVNVDAVQQRYRTQLRNHIESIHTVAHTLGARHCLIRTSEPPLQALRRVLGLELHATLNIP